MPVADKVPMHLFVAGMVNDQAIYGLIDAALIAIMNPGPTHKPSVETSYLVKRLQSGLSLISLRLLSMNMTCALCRMIPEDALHTAPSDATRILYLADRCTVAAGQRTDLTIRNVEYPAQLGYHIGKNPLNMPIFGAHPCKYSP